MSATSNLRQNLEYELSSLLGEREAVSRELRVIQEGVARLTTLHDRVRVLDEAIAAAKTLLCHDRPDYVIKAIKPRRRGQIDDNSPFKAGERGRTALSILQAHDDWMHCSEIAKIMLDEKGWDRADRLTREKLTKAIDAYFRKHKGDLVESDGRFGAKWRVIRK